MADYNTTEALPVLGQRLVHVAANLMSSSRRARCLYRYIQRHPAHVVSIQDPPKGFNWRPNAHEYEKFCEATTELQPDDDPLAILNFAKATKQEYRRYLRDDKAWLKRLQSKGPSLKKVAFLVHKSVPLTDWIVMTYDNHNSDLLATLWFNTPSGVIPIHNVYNHENRLNIPELWDCWIGNGTDMFVGDWNEHHRAWGGDRVGPNASKKAEELHSTMETAGMKLITTPGAITYTRSVQGDRYCSTIDLVFGGQTLMSWNPQWEVLDVKGFETDHRVTQTILDIEPSQKTSTRLDLKKVDKENLKETVALGLESLDDLSLSFISDMDKYAEKLIDVLDAGMTHCVPQTKPCIFHPTIRTSLSDKTALEEAQELAQIHIREVKPGEQYDPAVHRTLLTQFDDLRRRRERREYRAFVAKATKDSRGIYRLARMAKNFCQPKTSPHLRCFVVDKKTYRSAADLSTIFKDSTWPDPTEPEAQALPRPLADPQRPQHAAPQRLLDGELDDLIKKLKSGKAAGIDRVANEILKWTNPILLPYLTKLFEACISQSHHPYPFKKAKTIILKKANKKSYDVPNSWRPIALLSAVGKLLEAIVARRLRNLAAEHPLLPPNQFGVAGKCTTRALRHLLDPIYTAWCRDLKVSLLGLDITGAYDRVNRRKLLEVLWQKKIPDWIILFVWSFLTE